MDGRREPRLDRLVATGPLLVHFFDLAQLNCARAMPYVEAWRERYREHGLSRPRGALASLRVHRPRRADRGFAAAAGHRVAGGGRLGARDLAGLRLPRLALPVPLGERRRAALVPPGRGRLRGHRAGDPRGTRRSRLQRAMARARSLRSAPATSPARGSSPRRPSCFPGRIAERPWGGRRAGAHVRRAGAFLRPTAAAERWRSASTGSGAPVAVDRPGLHAVAAHESHESHRLELEPEPGVEIHSVQFAPGPPLTAFTDPTGSRIRVP